MKLRRAGTWSFIALLVIPLCACEPSTFQEDAVSAEGYTRVWLDCERHTHEAEWQFGPGIEGQVAFRKYWDDCMKERGYFY